ncbi:hypothetical protein CYMTET_36433, partial [Cymbomonas tetramitiformis]
MIAILGLAVHLAYRPYVRLLDHQLETLLLSNHILVMHSVAAAHMHTPFSSGPLGILLLVVQVLLWAGVAYIVLQTLLGLVDLGQSSLQLSGFTPVKSSSAAHSTHRTAPGGAAGGALETPRTTDEVMLQINTKGASPSTPGGSPSTAGGSEMHVGDTPTALRRAPSLLRRLLRPLSMKQPPFFLGGWRTSTRRDVDGGSPLEPKTPTLGPPSAEEAAAYSSIAMRHIEDDMENKPAGLGFQNNQRPAGRSFLDTAGGDSEFVWNNNPIGLYDEDEAEEQRDVPLARREGKAPE